MWKDKCKEKTLKQWNIFQYQPHPSKCRNCETFSPVKSSKNIQFLICLPQFFALFLFFKWKIFPFCSTEARGWYNIIQNFSEFCILLSIFGDKFTEQYIQTVIFNILFSIDYWDQEIKAWERKHFLPIPWNTFLRILKIHENISIQIRRNIFLLIPKNKIPQIREHTSIQIRGNIFLLIPKNTFF